MKLEIRKIGNSTGIILPKDLVARLGLKQGDSVFVSEGPDKTLTIATHDPHHDEVMRIGRELFNEYRETFKALAK
jgi:putative addiction module antidote